MKDETKQFQIVKGLADMLLSLVMIRSMKDCKRLCIPWEQSRPSCDHEQWWELWQPGEYILCQNGIVNANDVEFPFFDFYRDARNSAYMKN